MKRFHTECGIPSLRINETLIDRLRLPFHKSITRDVMKILLLHFVCANQMQQENAENAYPGGTNGGTKG